MEYNRGINLWLFVAFFSPIIILYLKLPEFFWLAFPILAFGFFSFLLMVFYFDFKKIELKDEELIVSYWLRQKRVFNLRNVPDLRVSNLSRPDGKPFALLYVQRSDGRYVRLPLTGPDGKKFAEEVFAKFSSLRNERSNNP